MSSNRVCWVLCHVVESDGLVFEDDQSYSQVVTEHTTPIKVFAQKATADSALERMKAELPERDEDGDYQYLCLHKVEYV
jgi:hypothetical protein